MNTRRRLVLAQASVAAFLLLTDCSCQGVRGAEAESDIALDTPVDTGTETPETATPPPPCKVDQWGSRGIGVRSFDFIDPARGDRPLPTLVYYPAKLHLDLEACTKKFFGTPPFDRFLAGSFCSSWDAEPDHDGAPHPIVVFSHGSGSVKEGQSFLLEYLASHGFVVAAMDHTGNCGPFQVTPEDEDMTITRALDFKFVLDRVIALTGAGDGPLANMGDPAHVGAAGHSWGGHTVLSVSGIEYSFDVIADDCKKGTVPDKYYCPLLDHKDLIEDAIPEKRVRATITYAHDAGHQVSGPHCVGAAGIETPLMQILGDEDPFVSIMEDGWDCHDNVKAAACTIVVHGAGHLGYTDMGDEAGFPQSRMFDLVRWYSTAFFAWQLAGNEACRDMLLDSAVAGGTSDHAAKCKTGP